MTSAVTYGATSSTGSAISIQERDQFDAHSHRNMSFGQSETGGLFSAKSGRLLRIFVLAIRRNMEGWRLAGAKCIAAPFGDPARGIGQYFQ
jgi:hypothetical protein